MAVVMAVVVMAGVVGRPPQRPLTPCLAIVGSHTAFVAAVLWRPSSCPWGGDKAELPANLAASVMSSHYMSGAPHPPTHPPTHRLLGSGWGQGGLLYPHISSQIDVCCLRARTTTKSMSAHPTSDAAGRGQG